MFLTFFTKICSNLVLEIYVILYVTIIVSIHLNVPLARFTMRFYIFILHT